MAGQLNEHPLAELIREISDAPLSGALRLTRKRAKVAVYFEAGEVIYAGANLRTYRLVECVKRWGVLNAGQIAGAYDAASDLEYGAALVDSGVLSREALAELVAHQASDLLCHALLWTDGAWEFDPRVRLSKEMHVRVKTRELLMEGARHLPAELAASRFKSDNEQLFVGENAPEDFSLLPKEAFVLTRVDRPTRIHEVVALSGLSEQETLCVVYSLALGGFLRRDAWPVALTEEEMTRARAILANSPKQSKFEAPIDVKRPPQKPEPAEVARDEQAELASFLTRLRLSSNSYQMLGLVRPVTDSDVKRAYHSLAKRFHPDRFRKTVDDQLHARVEAAFARMAQAYETLKNTQVRAAYDSTLLTRSDIRETPVIAEPKEDVVPEPRVAEGTSDSRQSPPAGSNDAPTPPSAEQQFQQGLAALKGGDQTMAISCLGDAARLEPSQARYRAHYGRALAGVERLRRSAEAELTAAVALDANNPMYRVMLAQLYVDIGLLRRAQGELRRALAIDPKNEPARKLLEKLS